MKSISVQLNRKMYCNTYESRWGAEMEDISRGCLKTTNRDGLHAKCWNSCLRARFFFRARFSLLGLALWLQNRPQASQALRFSCFYVKDYEESMKIGPMQAGQSKSLCLI